MPDPQDRMRVGVVLAPPEDVTTWLADGAAFDAAGADLLWLDLRTHPQVDPFVLAGALAAVTFRCLVVVDVAAADRVSPSRARAVDTVLPISRGRVLLVSDDDAEAAATTTAMMWRTAGTPEQAEQRDEPRDEGGVDPRRWEFAEMPEGRTAWRAALGDAAQRGLHGVIVPARPRLLDLLRNPDDDGDRRDLHLAQG